MTISSKWRGMIRNSAAAVLAISIGLTAPTPVQSGPILGGIGGAIGGSIMGGIFGGKRGSRAGALIGGVIGMANGAERASRRNDYYRQSYYPPASRSRAQTRSVASSNQIVGNVQSSLTRLGFNPGPIDGRMGKATSSAIQAYQRRYGLPVTGKPSQSLLQHMLRNGG